ncbi:DNA polymerase III PolC, partial [Actinomyces sp. oral taxon 178 str. F0338]
GALPPALEGLGTPLERADWLVVDVETTGLGRACEITEIGALRMRGTQVVDEFEELVRPSAPIPPFIEKMTGITTDMVAGADPVQAVYPRFAAWAGAGAPGRVLVAHNADFDMGFLARAARACSMPWRTPPSVDTLSLARLALPRPVVANHRLGTVARHFRTATAPGHRALGDARATGEVLCGLAGLAAEAGFGHVEDLVAMCRWYAARRP